MNCYSLIFKAPFQVAVEQEPIPPVAAHEVLVETAVTAISPGTEMLLYRGQMPTDVPLDATVEALNQATQYPLKYGYAAVGRVVEVGSAVDSSWRDQVVFAFHPHESYFTAKPDQLIPVPAHVAPETAVFLPNMETAVSFVMDGQPVIGEQVALFGQGIVGLLTTRLLSHYPLASLVTLDRYASRRDWSKRLGATHTFDPTAPGLLPELHAALQEERPYAGADLTYELSGNPQALDLAIKVTGYNGRIVIGSWYGQKRADLNLGGAFHRSHMQLISSQVSHIAPRWQGRWQKPRRLQTVWRMLAQHHPTQLITHRLPIQQAAQAYDILDQQPETAVQIILTYT